MLHIKLRFHFSISLNDEDWFGIDFVHRDPVVWGPKHGETTHPVGVSGLARPGCTSDSSFLRESTLEATRDNARAWVRVGDPLGTPGSSPAQPWLLQSRANTTAVSSSPLTLPLSLTLCLLEKIFLNHF